MTQKRFECDKGSRIIIDNETKLHYIMTLDWECSLITKLLNHFAEENEELKQDIRELQNDKLLTELQMKCDKKQGHIVVLENKIRRMRGAIHKLEWLASHRNADLQRENTQLKSELRNLRRLANELYMEGSE